MATTVDQARQMLDAAEHAGVKHMIEFSWRWIPHYQYLHQLVSDSFVGRGHHYHYRFLSNSGRRNDYTWRVIDTWQIPIFVQTIKHLLTWPRDQGIIVEGVFLHETLLKVASEDHIALLVSGRPFREAYFGHRHVWYAGYEDKTRVYQN